MSDDYVGQMILGLIALVFIILVINIIQFVGKLFKKKTGNVKKKNKKKRITK